jgi:hypothetical protein
LAQVLLEAEAESPSHLNDKWRALMREIAEEPNDKVRERFTLMALSKALLSQGISQVPEWPEALAQLDLVLQRAEAKAILPDRLDSVGFYFINLAVGLKSVAQLSDLFVRLDVLGPTARTQLLGRLHARPEEISHMINPPWVAEVTRQTLDAAKAAAAFAEMAARAESWGERDIAIRCHVARSIMFDEYLDDEMKALESLNLAKTRHGSDAVISRAHAKVAFRRKRHGEALTLMRELAEKPHADPVERAFLCREAAISASEVGQEEESYRWFEAARAAAEQTKSDSLRPMTIGLAADAALAQWRIGRRAQALIALAATLDEAATVDPDASLKSFYLHKALGHAFLWLSSEASGTKYVVDNQPTVAPPGFCSNPEPSEEIRTLPRASLEAGLYLLAIADIWEGDQAGLDGRLAQRMVGRHVFILETSRRLARLQQIIRTWDASRLAAALIDALEAMALGAESTTAGPPRGKGLHFADGDFPRLPVVERRSVLAETFVNDALFSVWLLGQLRELEPEPLICDTSRTLAEAGYAVPSFLEEGNETRQAEFVRIWRAFPTQNPLAEQVFETGLRMLEWAKYSTMSAAVLPDLGAWAAQAWPPVLADQRFRLRTPAVTVPAIEAALTKPCRPENRLRTILAAARPAFHAQLPPSIAGLLMPV